MRTTYLSTRISTCKLRQDDLCIFRDRSTVFFCISTCTPTCGSCVDGRSSILFRQLISNDIGSSPSMALSVSSDKHQRIMISN